MREFKYVSERQIISNGVHNYKQLEIGFQKIILSDAIKACVRYFLSNIIFFHQMIALQKL